MLNKYDINNNFNKEILVLKSLMHKTFAKRTCNFRIKNMKLDDNFITAKIPHVNNTQRK